jgi:L-alanine-DL-glutamate epimerase-like enolase superfamily enzyme
MRRRDTLRTLFGTAALGSIPQARAAGTWNITRIEPIVIRSGKAEVLNMPPKGAMTGGIGLSNRLNNHSPVYAGASQAVLVKVTADNGTVGWGECHAPVAPRVHQTIISDLLAPVLIGHDARDVEVLWSRMYQTQRLRGYATGFYMEAIAGVDLALWDILGKSLNTPLYRILGGKFRDRIPTYGSAGNPETAKQMVDAGFPAIKMGLSKGATKNLDLVASVSTAIKGRGELLIDSLGAYKLSEAVLIGRELEKLGNIGWWEDPLGPEDISGYKQLADALDLAICAGEEVSNRFQIRDWLEQRSVDILNPDVCRAGGISETRRIAMMADAYGLLWSPHVSTGAGPYRAASIHLAAATPNCVTIEGGSSHEGPLGNRLLRQPLDYKPGSVGVPEGPGLGIEFDEKALAAVTVG